MMTWWMERVEREKWLLGGAGGLLALLMLWQFFYQPIVDYHHDAERSYAGAQGRLEDMQIAAAQVAALQGQSTGSGERDASQSTRSLAMASARAKGLAVTRLQPGEDGSLTLWIDDADAKLVYDWIVTMQEDYGVSVQKASLSTNDGTATIRAQLQLAGRSEIAR